MSSAVSHIVSLSSSLTLVPSLFFSNSNLSPEIQGVAQSLGETLLVSSIPTTLTRLFNLKSIYLSVALDLLIYFLSSSASSLLLILNRGLYSYLLHKKSFAFSEGTVSLQLYYAALTLANHVLQFLISPADDFDYLYVFFSFLTFISAFCLAGSTCIVFGIRNVKFQQYKKPLLITWNTLGLYCFVLATLGYPGTRFEDTYDWLLPFIFGSWKRYKIMALWFVILMSSLSLIAQRAMNLIRFKTRMSMHNPQHPVLPVIAETQVQNRKAFHLLIVIVIIIGLHSDDVPFLGFALLAAIFIFCFIEAFRLLFRDHLAGALISQFVSCFTNSKKDNSETIVFTHIFLLLGTSLPVLREIFTTRTLHNSSIATLGLWTVGIGDACAPLLAMYIPSRRMPGATSKTILGFISFLVPAMVSSLVFILLTRNTHALLIFGSILAAGVYEAYTEDIDNLNISLVAMTAQSFMSRYTS